MDGVSESTAAPLRRPDCEIVWEAFVETYGRLILNWSRDAGLDEGEAAQFAEKLLALLVSDFLRVTREPELRFRAWLKFIVHSAWCRLIESEVGNEGTSSRRIVQLLLSVPAHDELLNRLDDECVLQRRRLVLPRVRALADPEDWEAFYRVILEGQPVEEAAQEMERGELVVRAAVYRVAQRLNQELKNCHERF